MIPREDFEEMMNVLKTEVLYFKDEVLEMQHFFDKLSEPLIKKAVRFVEKQLRNFPPEANQFGDDSKLNFFEEVCVMQQEGSLDDYYLVRNTVESCCGDAYDNLGPDEKFIINHQSYSFEDNGLALITDAFFSYAANYQSKRIEEAYYRRN